MLRALIGGWGYNAFEADDGSTAMDKVQERPFDLVLMDVRMLKVSGLEALERIKLFNPAIPVTIMTAYSSVETAIEALKKGAYDYLTKPLDFDKLRLTLERAMEHIRLKEENRILKENLGRHFDMQNIIGRSRAMITLLETVAHVAPSEATVMITGESGTGKELVARAVHELSPRRDGPWVAINCSAIPRDLLESELFGYVKGAFSGAAQNRSGRLEQARGGTLFLDEISELDPALQAKLLRVLQEREYTPLGADDVRLFDGRFLAASNRDLKALVAAGKFREDLFYRLDVYNIHVPPLRERRDDIALLARGFLQELAAEMNKHVTTISPTALDVLARHNWPGNIRELRNSVERATLSCVGDTIDVADLPPGLQTAAATSAPFSAPPSAQGLDRWLEEVERGAILRALAQTNGVQAQAAKILGISERSLWHRVKKLGIQIGRTVA